MPIWNPCLVCAGPLYACTCPQTAPPGPHLPPSANWYGYWYGYNTVEEVPKKHDHVRYPHRCEYCGRWCYRGFNQIEHEHGAECS